MATTARDLGRVVGERPGDDGVDRLGGVGGGELLRKLGGPGLEFPGRDRGEGPPGAEDRVVVLVRSVEDLGDPSGGESDAVGFELAGAGGFVDLAPFGLEVEGERGLDEGAEVVAEVGLDLGLQFGPLPGQDVEPFLTLLVVLRLVLLGDGGRQPGEVFGLHRAGEDAVERVVVLGRDRVELVVVAAGASHGQAEECRGSRRRSGRR